MRRPSRARATAKRPGLRSKNDLSRRGELDGGWKKILDSVKERINTSTRIATAAIMNDLAEIGPATTGKFRDSWQAIAVTGGINNPTPSGYPYKTEDIPRLDIKSSTMDRVRVFEIRNTAPYADIAMDLRQSTYKKVADPIGGIDFGVSYGLRPRYPSIRGDVIEGRGNKSHYSTAELDWYTTYINGGQMHDSVRLALSANYKRVVNLPPGRR